MVLNLLDTNNVKSITETTTLDDFLSTSAQMANTEFTAGLPQTLTFRSIPSHTSHRVLINHLIEC